MSDDPKFLVFEALQLLQRAEFICYNRKQKNGDHSPRWEATLIARAIKEGELQSLHQLIEPL